MFPTLTSLSIPRLRRNACYVAVAIGVFATVAFTQHTWAKERFDDDQTAEINDDAPLGQDSQGPDAPEDEPVLDKQDTPADEDVLTDQAVPTNQKPVADENVPSEVVQGSAAAAIDPGSFHKINHVVRDELGQFYREFGYVWTSSGVPQSRMIRVPIANPGIAVNMPLVASVAPIGVVVARFDLLSSGGWTQAWKYLWYKSHRSWPANVTHKFPGLDHMVPGTGHKVSATAHKIPGAGQRTSGMDHKAPGKNHNVPGAGNKSPRTVYNVPSTGKERSSTGHASAGTAHTAPEFGHTIPGNLTIPAKNHRTPGTLHTVANHTAPGNTTSSQVPGGGNGVSHSGTGLRLPLSPTGTAHPRMAGVGPVASTSFYSPARPPQRLPH